MSSIIILFFSALSSFIGSLQLGPVNLFVIDTALHQTKKNACWVSLGGVLPEFIYCALAVYAGTWFVHNSSLFLCFRIVLISVLTLLGLVYFFKKPKPAVPVSEAPVNAKAATSYFLKGFSLAILNPQLLPFWIFIMVYFNSIHFLEMKTQLDKLAYVTGAGLGAFILLFSIILMVHRFKVRILTFLNNTYYNKALGLLFIAIAIQQFISIL